MRRIRFTVIKNAIANVARGGAAAFVALALPHFLVRTLDHDRFAAWSLLLQIAAYASYLDFGLQTAVARFLAQYMERGEEQRKDWLISTALALLSCAAVVALLVMSAVVWQLPNLFHGVPAPLLSELRLAVLLLGGSAALLLPFSTFSGVLVGLHRNEFVALAIGGSRIAGAVAVLLAARRTHSLIALAACIAIANLAGGLIQVVAVRWLLPSLRLSYSCVRKAMAGELGRYCGGLTVWSFGMFLVCGLDVTIVGHFDFGAVGYYSIAASLITFFSGMNTAICSALMTPVAALHASGQIDRIRKLILKATRLNTFFNLFATVFMLLCGPLLLRLWVGAAYALQALPIVEILMIANAIRLVANPYASALIATDQQKHGIAQGIVEGPINLVSSVLLASWLGPVGVAIGTLIGAVCVLIWVCTVTLKRVTEPTLGRWCFVREGIVRPLACTLPVLLAASALYHRSVNVVWSAVLMISTALTCFLISEYGQESRLVAPRPAQL
jgi:O-antigen/teichoic acid export membrane protein